MEVLSNVKLRNLMIEKGLTVKALSRAARMSEENIEKMLKKNSPIKLPVLAKLTHALGCRAYELICVV